MARPGPVSGFPEFLPSQRAVELAVIDSLRETFELHGYGSIETRSVEPLDQLLRKGDTSNEVYVLRRLQAEANEADAGLGLHFDLTVPLARYVLEHAGKLEFPFRRYQIQRCWRGERPQEGRYREFTQADIDIIGRDELPADADAEVTLVLAEALSRLPVPPVTLQLNHRKLIEGFYLGMSIADPMAVMRCVDKLDKVASALVLGRASHRKMRQNIAIAVAFNALGIGLAVAGLVTTWVAIGIIVASVAAVLLSTLSLLRLDLGTGAAADADQDAVVETVIPARRMHCDACARRIRLKLGKLDGVRTVDADAVRKEVFVAYEPARVTEERLRDELGALGFR
jgi:ATP phosphoribosyltransferase regulatory subunit HisZ